MIIFSIKTNGTNMINNNIQTQVLIRGIHNNKSQ